jgi:hypothetical protein
MLQLDFAIPGSCMLQVGYHESQRHIGRLDVNITRGCIAVLLRM